jgi:multidrug resistance efflux pump
MKSYVWLVTFVGLFLLAGCDGLSAVGAQPAATSTAGVPLVSGSSNVIAEGNLVPRDWVRIMTRAGGEVAEVLVQEGDLVDEGAVLLRFGDLEPRKAALAAAQYEETAARFALDELNKTAGMTTAQANAAARAAEKALVDAQQVLEDRDSKQYRTDLDNARKDVNTYEQDLEDAQKEFNKYKDLDPANSDRKRTSDLLEDAQKKYNDAVRKRDLLINELDQAEAAVESAAAQLADAQRLAQARQNGPDPDQLALAEARLSNAEAQVKAAEKSIKDLEVRAPFTATVVDLDVSVGEVILPNQPVALLADFDTWYIETNDLTEIEVVKVSEGQTAVVVPDALPALRLQSSVERIAREAGRKGGDVTYTVRLKLNESDPALRWGMTVEVRFDER